MVSKPKEKRCYKMTKLKILLSISELDEAFKEMVDELSKYATVDIANLNDYSLKDYDIFIGKKLSKKKLAEANSLKYIFAYKTGVDNFPLKELQAKNIILINSHADSKIIAEYAFGLSISLVNRISEFDLNLRKGIWYDNDNLYWKSLFNMNVGLLGYGHIGKEIHKLLKQNNINTFTIDRGHKYDAINLVKDLNDLILNCDLIICSVPKTKDTTNMFDKIVFDNMKGKYIVNVGRSNVIDQNDLYDALCKHQLAGAAIDTWDEKPINKNTTLMPSLLPFEKLNNIILSPHAAMRVEEGHYRYVKDTTNNIINLITKNILINVVDYNKGY